MGYASLSQAREFVAAGYGSCDKCELTEVVNAIRQHLFSMYEDVGLFMDAIEMFRVQDFHVIGNKELHHFKGITLPANFQTVEALWYNDFPVDLKSDWYEWQVGISPESQCELQKIDLPGSFSTFADIREPSPIIVSAAFNPSDIGKTITIRGLAPDGRMLKETLALATIPQQTSNIFARIEPRAGVTKDRTLGAVVILDQCGNKLGFYNPEDTMPTYRRIKILGLPKDEHCHVVNIRASRRFALVHNDDDVVETDNRMVWDAMARYLRLYRKADKTQEGMTAEQAHYATAKGLILGDKARDIGKSTNTEVKILTPRFYGRGLNRTSNNLRFW